MGESVREQGGVKPCPSTHELETGQRYRCTQERDHPTDHGTSCVTWPRTADEVQRCEQIATVRASKRAASAPPAAELAPKASTGSAQPTLPGVENVAG